MSLQISVDVRDLRDLRQSLQLAPKELERVQLRSLNRTATQSRNEIQRDIPLNLPAARKKQALRVDRATKRTLTAEIFSPYQDTPLTWFNGWREVRGAYVIRGATKTNTGFGLRGKRSGNSGLYVTYRTDGDRLHISQGFIARRRASFGGRAFKRGLAAFPGKQGAYYEGEAEQIDKLVPRLPIWPIYGPSVYDEYTDRLPRYQKRASDLYQRILNRELDYEVGVIIGKIPRRTRSRARQAS